MIAELWNTEWLIMSIEVLAGLVQAVVDRAVAGLIGTDEYEREGHSVSDWQFSGAREDPRSAGNRNRLRDQRSRRGKDGGPHPPRRCRVELLVPGESFGEFFNSLFVPLKPLFSSSRHGRRSTRRVVV